MSSLASRSLVLAFARLLNQGLLMLSPVLLVRLLEIGDYGRYKQFTVTAGLLIGIASFSIAGNVNYFVARSPKAAPVFMTNSALLMAATSALAVGGLALLHPLIVPEEIAAFWPLLAAYVLLFLNLDLLAAYWLAQGRSDRVLGYTVAVTALRLAAVVGAAALSGDVQAIFVAMVVAESLKALAVLVFLRRRRLLVGHVERATLREQLHYIVPFGVGTLLFNLHDGLGKLIVGKALGPEALAIYAIAAYQVPILTIVKNAIADVIFPDMVQRSHQDRLAGLRLWRRANVVLVLLIVPAWLLLTHFAGPLVRLLFTDTYAPAVPYFRAFLLLMILQCFAFSTPLRSVARTRPLVSANVVGLALNLAITVTLLPRIGLWAPALGLLVGQTWVTGQLARAVLRHYAIPLAQLLAWPALARIAAAGALAFAVLRAVESALGSTPAAMLGAAAAFAAAYLAVVRLLQVEELHYVIDGLRRRFRPAVST